MVIPYEPLLRQTAAPWSPAARDDIYVGKGAIEGLADSFAQRRLVEEIKRYACGDVSGRAFLLAGHRGAGKTTAVLAALQQVYNDCQEGVDPRLRRRRPLLVRLHAPSLLLDGPDIPPYTAEPTLAERSVRHSTRFLREMAAGIFPALIDELRRQLGRALDRRPGETTGPGALQAREIIAHVCDELSRGMTLAELRELFRRLGLLESGILGNVDVFRELVAIQAASEAYLIVTGKLETEQNSGQKLLEQLEAKASHTLAGETWVKALTPVSAALVAAFGLSGAHAFAGVTVALGILLSGLSFSWSTARARSRSAASTRSFTRDNSHESLVRHVPLLVEQLREVGFPVVFVLDELDKLEQPRPEELLGWLMRNLKSYVTERSFLCFVVERSYYERVFGIQRAPGSTLPRSALYGIEHTFYSDAAYVVPTQAALHRYLRVLLQEDQAPALQQLHLATFRHVLVNRSRVHAYDLQRELRRSLGSGEIEAIAARAEVFRPPLAWLYAAFFELCIEWVMSEARLRRRALEDAYFAQMEQDLLYEVSCAWRDSEAIAVEPAQIAQRVLASGVAQPDRPMLEHALLDLLVCLREPTQLLQRVHRELDLERLELFFCQGEQAATDLEVSNAQSELSKTLELRGRNPKRLARCFATRKYVVLHDLVGRQLRPLLAEDSASWLVDPRGHTAGEAKLDDVDLARIHALSEFRELLSTRGLLEGLPFAALWGAAVGPSLSWAQLELALHDNEARPHDADSTGVIERFSDIAPAAAQLTALLLLGVSLLGAISRARGQAQVAQPALLELLQRGIQGTTVETRATATAHLLDQLARLHQVGLSERMRALIRWLRLPMERVAELDLALEPRDLVIAGTPRVELPQARARWLELLAERMAGSLSGRASDPSSEEEGARYDLIAALHAWFPPALSSLWTTFARPNEWTIMMCSELLADAPSGPTPDDALWLRAFAAARLGLRDLAEELLRAARAAPLGAAASQVCDWAEQRRASLAADPRRVLLVNPRRVMRQWLPVPGVAAVSVQATDFSELTWRTDYDLVFNETEAARPAFLLGSQYVLVRPAPQARGTQPWLRQNDDTLVLLGPASLSQAIEWILEGLAR